MADTLFGKKSIESDRASVAGWLKQPPDTEPVAGFVPGPGIERLHLKFDPAALRGALDTLLERVTFEGADMDSGFGAIALTRRPGEASPSDSDLSGRYWMRPDAGNVEEAKEDEVDERAFSELIPACADTYFAPVYRALTARFPIGRVRLLRKTTYNCNSWHRDPEPRLHIPIISNPGSLFLVNNHCTHLPADGSVYFTDTRGYHTALNGGLVERIHLVASLPID